MGELYDRTILKEERVRAAGYNLVSIWETEWNTALLHGARAAEPMAAFAFLRAQSMKPT